MVLAEIVDSGDQIFLVDNIYMDLCAPDSEREHKGEEEKFIINTFAKDNLGWATRFKVPSLDPHGQFYTGEYGETWLFELIDGVSKNRVRHLESNWDRAAFIAWCKGRAKLFKEAIHALE